MWEYFAAMSRDLVGDLRCSFGADLVFILRLGPIQLEILLHISMVLTL